MQDATTHLAVKQLQSLLRGFLLDGTAGLASVLTRHDVLELIAQEVKARGERLFPPLVTLCLLLRQVVSDDGSCRAAVAELNATRVAHGQAPGSALTGGYCKARHRLPERLLQRLVSVTGQRLEQHTPPAWHWHGRSVKVVDGSSVSMPDTPANQAAYPQPNGQAPGCGFPTARVVVVMSLACGAVLAGALGRLQGKGTGELALFDSLHETIAPGEVVLADRYYCTYWEVAALAARRVDVVMRLHARRRVDFRRGQRLGRDDHRVRWRKPPRPAWMTPSDYEAMPEHLTMREVRVPVTRPGFRTRALVVATTLHDVQRFTHAAIADLYRTRWQGELDLRAIKQTLGMDVLRCQSPAMVRKEVWAHLVVYNLLRAAMAQAALAQPALPPRQVSLQGARQTLSAFHQLLAHSTCAQRPRLVAIILHAIAAHRVGARPDRYEPRVRKRRPKPYPLMTMPRQQARARLARAA